MHRYMFNNNSLKI